MRLGYFAMPLHPPGADPAKTMDDDLAQLATLDRLGYEEAWIGEHFTAQWENIPCPDLFIARALGMTKKMKLATGVSCLPNHDPLMLAQRIAQLDQMARGRFYWGVGSGGFPGDFEMFGVDPKSGEHRVITREMPADRRGGRVREQRDAHARRRARLHSDVDQLRSAANLEDALGGRGDGRSRSIPPCRTRK